MIHLDNIVKRYSDGHEALRGVSLEIAAGEMIFVTGDSGAGKSTLLKLIAGVEKPSRGTVLINQQNLGRLGASALARLRQNIGLVFQDHKLLFDRSVWENAALPLRIAGGRGDDMRRRVTAALEKVGLREKAGAYPVALSGGERQRLCIARAIVNRPSLLIADEPTGNLDGRYARTIMDIFKSFHEVGVTLVIASHDESALSTQGGRIIRLQDGQLADDSETEAAEFDR
jgi:cell division transport system ATP-binding protein